MSRLINESLSSGRVAREWWRAGEMEIIQGKGSRQWACLYSGAERREKVGGGSYQSMRDRGRRRQIDLRVRRAAWGQGLDQNKAWFTTVEA